MGRGAHQLNECLKSGNTRRALEVHKWVNLFQLMT